MQKLLAKKEKIEQEIAHLSKVEELEKQISTLLAQKEALLAAPASSAAPVKRGAPKKSEMTPEQLAKHETRIAENRAKKEASSAEASSAESSVVAKEKKARPPMSDEHKAKLAAGRAAWMAKKTLEKIAAAKAVLASASEPIAAAEPAV